MHDETRTVSAQRPCSSSRNIAFSDSSIGYNLDSRQVGLNCELSIAPDGALNRESRLTPGGKISSMWAKATEAAVRAERRTERGDGIVSARRSDSELIERGRSDAGSWGGRGPALYFPEVRWGRRREWEKQGEN